MTREHKLALVVGFSLVLVVGVLISDHFSKARLARLAAADVTEPVIMPSAFGTDPRTPPAPAVAGRMPSVINNAVDNGYPTLGPTAEPTNQEPAAPTAPVIDMGVRPTLASAAAEQDDGRTALHSIQPELPLTGELVPVPAHMDPVEPPVAKPEPSKTSPPVPAGPISKGTLQRHEVVKGDTIGRLADRYYGDRSLWKQLQLYNKNRVTSEGVMRAGVTLLIPPKDVLLGQASLPGDAKIGVPPAAAAKDTDKAKTAEKAVADKSKSGTVYTVQSGDTLLSIAARQLGNKAKWEQIRDLNADTLDDEDTLVVGQKLKLPPRGS